MVLSCRSEKSNIPRPVFAVSVSVWPACVSLPMSISVPINVNPAAAAATAAAYATVDCCRAEGFVSRGEDCCGRSTFIAPLPAGTVVIRITHPSKQCNESTRLLVQYESYCTSVEATEQYA